MFIDQQGRRIPAAPPTAATTPDLDELDPCMAQPKWDGTPMDLADSLAWMFIADQTRTRTAAHS
jgi:hypothetical protein